MKKIISLLLVTFLFTTTVIASPIIDKTQEYTLVRGVEYKNIKGLYESGWQDIHVVTADLTEDHLSLEILKNKNGESYLERTNTSAENNDTVIAVNGDFFAAKKGEAGRGSAVGVEIRDGKLYSSASVQESMNTLYKAFDETGFNIDAFTFDITLTAANGLQDKIKLINKYDDLTGIVMYTSDWNDYSVGSIGGIIEVSVDKDGKVLEKVTESEALKIPDGGYVLSAHMSYNTFLLDNVNVGDKIEIDIKSTPDYKKIETAVGGGGVLVSDGVAQTSFSHNVGGKNPRTAVGLDKTGTKMTFVILDGRRTDARGMTQTELAELMVELGCYTALNFDGGGSSIMVVDDFSQKKVVNTPSDG
ncbi:MAG: phosphodiester glycosidase family protein, partial [Clostridia bacterium]|nr:phosphodiester glycosidase family protein [Clostridia bacterium]